MSNIDFKEFLQYNEAGIFNKIFGKRIPPFNEFIVAFKRDVLLNKKIDITDVQELNGYIREWYSQLTRFAQGKKVTLPTDMIFGITNIVNKNSQRKLLPSNIIQNYHNASGNGDGLIEVTGEDYTNNRVMIQKSSVHELDSEYQQEVSKQNSGLKTKISQKELDEVEDEAKDLVISLGLNPNNNKTMQGALVAINHNNPGLFYSYMDYLTKSAEKNNISAVDFAKSFKKLLTVKYNTYDHDFITHYIKAHPSTATPPQTPIPQKSSSINKVFSKEEIDEYQNEVMNNFRQLVGSNPTPGVGYDLAMVIGNVSKFPNDTTRIRTALEQFISSSKITDNSQIKRVFAREGFDINGLTKAITEIEGSNNNQQQNGNGQQQGQGIGSSPYNAFYDGWLTTLKSSEAVRKNGAENIGSFLSSKKMRDIVSNGRIKGSDFDELLAYMNFRANQP